MKRPWNGPNVHLSSTGNAGDRPVCSRPEGRGVSATLPEREFYATRAADRCAKCEVINGRNERRRLSEQETDRRATFTVHSGALIARESVSLHDAIAFATENPAARIVHDSFETEVSLDQARALGDALFGPPNGDPGDQTLTPLSWRVN